MVPTPHFQVGSEIEVLATDNVLRRFPNLVGEIGVIETTPIHPNIWYTIYFKCLDAAIKLQQNAVKLRPPKKSSDKSKINTKNSSPVDKEKHNQNQKSNVENKSNNSKISNREEVKTKIKEKELNLSIDASDAKKIPCAVSSPSHIIVPVSYLKVGTKVIILGTENVHQRVPQLEGAIGTVKEAPVHPATWFKVQFPDKNIYTFRPSALRPVNEDGSLIPLPTNMSSPSSQMSQSPVVRSMKEKPNLPTLKELPTSKVAAATAKIETEEVPESNTAKPRSGGKKSALLLSTLDPELWDRQEVLLIGGKFDGHTGQVVSSGNGWVQVQTSLGEVAKRAYELQVLGDGNSAQKKLVKKVFRAPASKPEPVVEKPAPVPSRAARSVRDRPPFPPTKDESTTSSSNPTVTATVLSKKVSEPVVGQKRSLPSSATNANATVHIEKKPVDQHYNNSNATNNAVPNTAPPVKILKSDPFIEARRVFVAKFVAKQQQKIKSRPHLSNWKYQMDAVMYSNSASIELQGAREFEETYCDVCCTEKWPGAKFCWNELCSVSPIFYKLPRVDDEPYVAPSSPRISPRTSPVKQSSRDALEENKTNGMNHNNNNNNDKTVNVKDSYGYKKSSIYSFSEIQPNPITSFLLQAPSCVLSANTEKYEDEEAKNNSNSNNNVLNCEEMFDIRNKVVQSDYSNNGTIIA